MMLLTSHAATPEWNVRSTNAVVNGAVNRDSRNKAERCLLMQIRTIRMCVLYGSRVRRAGLQRTAKRNDTRINSRRIQYRSSLKKQETP